MEAKNQADVINSVLTLALYSRGNGNTTFLPEARHAYADLWAWARWVRPAKGLHVGTTCPRRCLLYSRPLLFHLCCIEDRCGGSGPPGRMNGLQRHTEIYIYIYIFIHMYIYIARSNIYGQHSLTL